MDICLPHMNPATPCYAKTCSLSARKCLDFAGGFCYKTTVLSGVLGDRVVSEEDAAAHAGGRAADDQR